MSDKCKTLMQPDLVSWVDSADGILWESFLKAAPPADEFAGLVTDPRSTDADDVVYVVAGVVDKAERRREASRRLAAIVRVEIASGAPTVVHCKRALRSAWQRLLQAVMHEDAPWQGGAVVAETATTATFEFASAAAAVHWAMGAQRLAEGRCDVAASGGLRLRISIGVGEVHDAATMLEGHGLNDPAGIGHLGRPGGVLVTKTVLDLIRYVLQPGVTRIDVPEAMLHGDEVCLYALKWDT